MALATTFNDIEKAVQEKLFYKLFFIEYYQNENMIINGFRMNERFYYTYDSYCTATFIYNYWFA